MGKTKIMGMLLILLLCCCGCGSKIRLQINGDNDIVVQIGDSLVDMAEIKTIMLEYKEAYSQYHMNMDASSIWEETTKQGITYEEQLLYHYVLDEIVTLEILQMLAKENNIVLTEEEVEMASLAAKAYMEALNEASKEYSHITLEKAQKLMEKYALGQKAIDTFLVGKNWEVSENDARVITLQIMELSDFSMSQNAMQKLQQGTSFQQVYLEMFGEQPKDYTIVRSDLRANLEEKAYRLKTGERTNSLRYIDENGVATYFILYCVNDYIPELTTVNRQVIENERKAAYWMPMVEEKRKTLSLYVDEGKLQREDFRYTDEMEANFFELYDSYFQEVEKTS